MPHQHGFVPQKSCVSQLAEVFEQKGRKLDNGKQIDVIYLDMSKAFDKVSHAQLLRRLIELGFRGNLPNGFPHTSAIVINRKLLVEQHQDRYQLHPVFPRALFLVPCCFSCTKSTSPENVRYSISTFADDTKIFKTIHVSDAHKIKTPQNKISLQTT